MMDMIKLLLHAWSGTTLRYQFSLYRNAPVTPNVFGVALWDLQSPAAFTRSIYKQNYISISGAYMYPL